MMWNLQSYPTTVLNEIMWHFSESKHADPSPPTYFQGARTLPKPPWYTPLSVVVRFVCVRHAACVWAKLHFCCVSGRTVHCRWSAGLEFTAPVTHQWRDQLRRDLKTFASTLSCSVSYIVSAFRAFVSVVTLDKSTLFYLVIYLHT